MCRASAATVNGAYLQGTQNAWAITGQNRHLARLPHVTDIVNKMYSPRGHEHVCEGVSSLG